MVETTRCLQSLGSEQMVGAQECIGNWGEAKLVSALSALGQAKVDLSPFSFGSSWLMRLIHADLRTGQLITCWDED
jgi:hypothetical protein